MGAVGGNGVDGNQPDQSRREPCDPTPVEVGERDPAGERPLLEEQGRDQEPAQNKEKVDASDPSRGQTKTCISTTGTIARPRIPSSAGR